MGQKVNPTGLRLGFNQDWHAHWFSEKNFASQLKDDTLIKDDICNEKLLDFPLTEKAPPTPGTPPR